MRLPKPVSEYYGLIGIQALLVDDAIELFRGYVPEEKQERGMVLSSGKPRSEVIHRNGSS